MKVKWLTRGHSPCKSLVSGVGVIEFADPLTKVRVPAVANLQHLCAPALGGQGLPRTRVAFSAGFTRWRLISGVC